jgi:hypothetical protein
MRSLPQFRATLELTTSRDWMEAKRMVGRGMSERLGGQAQATPLAGMAQDSSASSTAVPHCRIDSEGA